MMEFIKTKWFQLAGIGLAFILVSFITSVSLYNLWRGVFRFGEDYRGQPIDSGLVIIMGLFALIFLVLYARKVLRQRPQANRRLKR